MYELFIVRHAEKDLDSLPRAEFERVLGKIQNLASQPFPPGAKKLSGEENSWRIRVGDYRILYAVDQPKKQIVIFRVRHRREVYR